MRGHTAEHDLNLSDTWPTNLPLFQLHVGKKNIEGLTYDSVNGETLITLDIREGDLEKEIFEYDLKVGDVLAKHCFYNIKSATTFKVKWTDAASGALILEDSFTAETITNWGANN